ncbi:MAG: HAMP domain-containing protein [Thermodesulfobacteriota bacterium]
MQTSDVRALKDMGEQLRLLGQGADVGRVACGPEASPEIRELSETLNEVLVSFTRARAFICALAEGNLDAESPPHNLLASPYKQLHAGLKHLRWQTRQIADGDYSQRVHFMGDFSTAFNSMVEALEEKQRLEDSLRKSQARVKQLEGIIPICMYCKRIRDDGNSWQRLEKYITEHSEASFSHGICPSCVEEHYGDILKKGDKTKKKGT